MSERIQYIPPNLEYLLTDMYAPKRFKNRSGYGVLLENDQQTLVEGNMLEVHATVLEHVSQDDNHYAQVFEHRCNSQGFFDPIKFEGKEA